MNQGNNLTRGELFPVNLYSVFGSYRKKAEILFLCPGLQYRNEKFIYMKILNSKVSCRVPSSKILIICVSLNRCEFRRPAELGPTYLS